MELTVKGKKEEKISKQDLIYVLETFDHSDNTKGKALYKHRRNGKYYFAFWKNKRAKFDCWKEAEDKEVNDFKEDWFKK